MSSKMICRLAARLMRHPAAPYHEHAVRDEVERICREHGLSFKQDRFGNVLVELKTAPKLRSLALAAHLDHPGFEILPRRSNASLLARFCGGVPDSYFIPGVKLRLMPGRQTAKLGKRLGKERIFEVQTRMRTESKSRFAVWEMEDFVIKQGRIFGRACDDLIGVAAILATLIELRRARSRVNVLGIISRAEEVGFHGALACAASSDLPKDALVISLETSRELPGVKMAQGVIIRVGDRASVFDAKATRFLEEVAAERRVRDKGFQYQRALMSGGTCEATAYQEFRFQTAAVCVALGNYHNCAAGNRIKTEYVSIADVCSMVELLVAGARQMPRFRKLIGKLPQRLAKLLREARRKLPATAAISLF